MMTGLRRHLIENRLQLGFIKNVLKRIYKETERKRKISEKKRKISEKREFSLEKKSLLKNSLSQRKFSFYFLSTSNAFSTSSNCSNSSNTSNYTIFAFIRHSPGKIREKFMKENFVWEQRIFSKEIFFQRKEIFFRENSLFSEIFLFFSVSLQILF